MKIDDNDLKHNLLSPCHWVSLLHAKTGHTKKIVQVKYMNLLHGAKKLWKQLYTCTNKTLTQVPVKITFINSRQKLYEHPKQQDPGRVLQLI